MKIINLLAEEERINTCLEGEDVVANMYYRYRLIDFNKPIVITFPPNRESVVTDPSILPFNFKFLCGFDVNVICFGVLGAHSDNYFIDPTFSSFVERLGDALRKFKLRLGYSNSKGGFGIGAYGRVLGLDYALLFHPVSTKSKKLAPWDTRLTTHDAERLDWSTKYNDVDLGGCKGYIVYDPSNTIDVKHAERFKGLEHIKVNGLGHGNGYYFLAKSSKIISEAIRDFLYFQKIDVPRFKKDTKFLRFSASYYDSMLRRRNANPTLLLGKKRLESVLNSPLNKKLINSSSLSSSEVNSIRDAALALESVDLDKALSLMEIAFKIRPDGPLIQRKIKMYREAVKNKNI